MILGLALLVVGLVAVAVPTSRARAFTLVALGVLAVATVVDATAAVATTPIADLLDRVGPLALVGDDPTSRSLLLGAVAWCGPAADLLVRAVLEATGLPAPERAAETGFRAGRWVGRLERWTLLVVVAAGEPTLAIIPTGGKALLRYAEAVADARASRDSRLAVPDEPPAPGRDAFLDYVLVGSLASWGQALVLGLLAAA
jgi:hypothetical protein